MLIEWLTMACGHEWMSTVSVLSRECETET